MEEIRNPLLLQILKTYNYRMKALREERKYSMRELAELSGISITTIYKFESLQNIPREDTLEKIAYALNTTINYIFPDSMRELIELKFPHKIRKYIGEDKVLAYVEHEKLRLKDESSPERKLLLEDKNKIINKALDTLTRREAEVVKMYYGINYETNYTLEEIGKKFGLGRERIRQIKEKAIRRLRHTNHSVTLREYL